MAGRAGCGSVRAEQHLRGHVTKTLARPERWRNATYNHRVIFRHKIILA